MKGLFSFLTSLSKKARHGQRKRLEIYVDARDYLLVAYSFNHNNAVTIGICIAIREVGYKKDEVDFDFLPEMLKIRKQRILTGAIREDSSFWWPRTEDGFRQRICFLDKTIETLCRRLHKPVPPKIYEYVPVC